MEASLKPPDGLASPLPAGAGRPLLRLSASALLAVLLAGALLLSVTQGAVQLSVAQIGAILLERLGFGVDVAYTTIQANVLLNVRLPRVVLALLVGCGMAAAGAAMQALFRNPLADPGIVGVSSGAALGAVAWIVLAGKIAWLGALSGWLGSYAQPAAAFVGGVLASWLIYRLARLAIADGQTLMLLLAGIAFSALAGAATGLLTYIADDQQLRSITFWTMGSLGGAGWAEIRTLAVFILPATAGLLMLARLLDALLLGEDVAGHLGFDLARVRPLLVMLVAVLVGASVAMTGMIGFIGLMAPHIARLWMGPGHVRLLPAAAMTGALLLVCADMAARTVAAPAEVPVGLITALLGGPFFLALLSGRLGAR
ncbi:iron ABC transporter permease [Pseudothauera nasutitermitis]|uniref:Iron ABC transporter permease n=1 Tax=Pseudothauera nasutitermitis TaxID=2565930 RepID=A0A4S4ALW6_9RHOO|nr:iron ABC transporter permease [Pseudothauera nasutitermitis]THF60569.1 iron ABC transporter permease [Pseudothauera nasutitermitis]